MPGCCGFVTSLVVEVVGWLLAIIAITTSFWLSDTGSVVRSGAGVSKGSFSHAGLWISCSVPTVSSGPATVPPPSIFSSPPLPPAAEMNGSIQDSIAAVAASAMPRYALPLFPPSAGSPTQTCGDARERFASLNGGDYSAHLIAMRTLSLSFLALGLAKVAILLVLQCNKASSGNSSTKWKGGAKAGRCSGTTCSLAALLATLQSFAGTSAWSLCLTVIIQAAGSSHTRVDGLWGWSFWLFGASVICSVVAGSTACCV